MFHENSGLVQSWARLIRSGAYSKEQVPRIGNLREIVFSILEKNDAEEKADG